MVFACLSCNQRQTEGRKAIKEVDHFPINVIYEFMIDVFEGLGTPSDDARIGADVLITSDPRGIESHGVGRLKHHYDHTQTGVQQTPTFRGDRKGLPK